MTDTIPAVACDKNTQADLIAEAKADLDALVAKKADAEAKGRK